MAVFMLNVCKFNACGLTFKSLGHLIQHIEETHIDYDPRVVEQTEQQQPTCVPLSYVLRFLTDAARRENAKPVQARANQPSLSASTRVKSLTPTGSEADEGEDFVSEPEDSNDSWTTLEEFSADFILHYGSRIRNASSPNSQEDKPFACPVPGCKKRYKNVNGIKYHSKNGHKNDGKVRKAFKCPCGKSYKTHYGLKNHAALRHSESMLQVQLLQPTSKPELESLLSPVPRVKISKVQVPAIEDHGYIKQTFEYESDLGVLTPTPSPQSPAKARRSATSLCKSASTVYYTD